MQEACRTAGRTTADNRAILHNRSATFKHIFRKMKSALAREMTYDCKMGYADTRTQRILFRPSEFAHGHPVPVGRHPLCDATPADHGYMVPKGRPSVDGARTMPVGGRRTNALQLLQHAMPTSGRGCRTGQAAVDDHNRYGCPVTSELFCNCLPVEVGAHRRGLKMTFVAEVG